MDEVMAALDNGNSEAADGGSAVLGGPVPDSPRTVWFRENRKMLDEKEEEEKVAKQAVKQVAVEFMEKFHKERASRIDERKKANRSEEQQTVEAGSGLLGDTEWERIISLINFNLGAQQKDTSRLRSMLFQAREVNLGATE